MPNRDWDAITLQPFPRADSTLGSDVRRIRQFIDLAQSNGFNGDTRFYVYAAFPGPGRDPVEGTFASQWLAPSVDDLSTPTALSRAYFQNLLGRLNTGDTPRVEVIPIGETLFDLIELANAGGLGDLREADFFRDDIHLSLEVGRYAARLTNYATLFEASVADFGTPRFLTDDQASAFRSVIDANVAQVIPEPTSLAGAGVLVVLGLRRRVA